MVAIKVERLISKKVLHLEVTALRFIRNYFLHICEQQLSLATQSLLFGYRVDSYFSWDDKLKVSFFLFLTWTNHTEDVTYLYNTLERCWGREGNRESDDRSVVSMCSLDKCYAFSD